ncbi:MAG: glutathione S-transferase [Caulobacter sp.]|nr:glutathione S-transferase [Caulobacter sp.]
MSDQLTFYTSPMSRGRVIRWMLEEVGVPYDTMLVDLRGPKGDYHTINSMLKVPTIVHNGRTVTETPAICAYLAEAFPQAGLAPTADERADYYRWMFFASGPVEAATTNRTLGVEVPPELTAMVGYGHYDRMVETLEQGVSAHAYIAGPRFTAADVYVGSQIGWLSAVGALPKRDAFDAYLGRIMGRPAAVRARGIDDALIAEAASAG